MKKLKHKKPSWKEDNSLKKLKKIYGERGDVRERKKANENFAKLLVENGWVYWDAYNIWERGYTLSFKKPCLASNRDLHFAWHWSDHGGDFFWGEMSLSYDFNPEYRHLKPYLRMEIDGIMDHDMKNLNRYEDSILTAVSEQGPIK